MAKLTFFAFTLLFVVASVSAIKEKEEEEQFFFDDSCGTLCCQMPAGCAPMPECNACNGPSMPAPDCMQCQGPCQNPCNCQNPVNTNVPAVTNNPYFPPTVTSNPPFIPPAVTSYPVNLPTGIPVQQTAVPEVSNMPAVSPEPQTTVLISPVVTTPSPVVVQPSSSAAPGASPSAQPGVSASPAPNVDNTCAGLHSRGSSCLPGFNYDDAKASIVTDLVHFGSTCCTAATITGDCSAVSAKSNADIIKDIVAQFKGWDTREKMYKIIDIWKCLDKKRKIEILSEPGTRFNDFKSNFDSERWKMILDLGMPRPINCYKHKGQDATDGYGDCKKNTGFFSSCARDEDCDPSNEGCRGRNEAAGICACNFKGINHCMCLRPLDVLDKDNHPCEWQPME